MFFCPEVALVIQQYKVLKELLEEADNGYGIEYLVGAEVTEKPPIDEMIGSEDVSAKL